MSHSHHRLNDCQGGDAVEASLPATVRRERHIVSTIAGMSLDGCASAILMNARGIVLALKANTLRLSDDHAGVRPLEWIPQTEQQYASLLMRAIRIRMARQSSDPNDSLASVLSALEDDGIAIYMAFMASEAQRDRLRALRTQAFFSPGMRSMPPLPSDPARLVFMRIQEILRDSARTVAIGDDQPWLYWLSSSSP